MADELSQATGGCENNRGYISKHLAMIYEK